MNVQIRTAALAAMVLMSGVLVLSGQEPVESASAPGAFPVTIENCGVSTIYLRPPRRVVTMNQAATELMLELGLENHLVGTAYLDDAILPALAAAYQKIPVLATMYQSRDELTAVQPDFVFAAYPSAFAVDCSTTGFCIRGVPQRVCAGSCRATRRPWRALLRLALQLPGRRSIGKDLDAGDLS